MRSKLPANNLDLFALTFMRVSKIQGRINPKGSGLIYIYIYIYPIECPMEYPVDTDSYREKSGVSQDLMIQPLNCRFLSKRFLCRKPKS